MTSSGIGLATFRLVAQCLNQLSYCVPPPSVPEHRAYINRNMNENIDSMRKRKFQGNEAECETGRLCMY
jgi:hypothetical protein